MRFAFAIFRYFPFGGLQRSALNIAKEAVARGHSVTFFCGAWEGERPDDIEIQELKKSLVFNTAGVRSFITAFEHTFQRDQFDLLLGFNKMPGLDAYYCGDSCFAKKAFDERSWWYRLAPRSRYYLANEEAVFSCDTNTRILDVSNAERSEFARFYGTAATRFYLLPPGISKQHVLLNNPIAGEQRKPSIRAEFAIPTTAKLITCIGSGFKTKGLDRSIAAFADLLHRHKIDAYLLVVGADKSAKFRAQAKRLGVAARVIFTGGRSDLAATYQTADALLHPAYREVTGNVLLEAMLAGIPVVTTDICGYASYVQQYNFGTVVAAPYAITDITQALADALATEKHHWHQQSEQLVKQADIFSRSKHAINLLEHFVDSPTTQEQWQCQDQQLVIREPLLEHLNAQSAFESLKQISGTVARAMPGRVTLRISLGDQFYYRKWHSGVGWREIGKNLLTLRLPVIGASNEWYALNKLAALNIPSLTAVAFGRRGLNPARQESFIVTAELAGMVKLDALFKQESVTFEHKRLIITEVARIARAMHGAGINHRDFYLCHLLLDPNSLASSENNHRAIRIFLVDLHRAQLRPKVPYRWRVKDIGGLYFSALDLGFSQHDMWFFLSHYFAQNIADLLATHGSFLAAVEARAIATYRRDFGRSPQLPLSSSRNTSAAK